ncbi:MAG: hydrogenase subunit MbhD domain-containing protein [Lachnospiraceae bacterium]|nr:hydrogenase subunit MbhD domain-containing protein [Lachnospiraceae bacterium]
MSGILVTVLNTFVIIGAVVSAITAVHAERLISSVLALAATGSFIGLEFILLQAPDVGIAEVSVGAILSTILYIIALRKCREVERVKKTDELLNQKDSDSREKNADAEILPETEER